MKLRGKHCREIITENTFFRKKKMTHLDYCPKYTIEIEDFLLSLK